MNKLKVLLLFLVVAITTAAQQPVGFSYQAVLRNSSGQVLANQNVTLRLSLTDASGTTTYYSESHALQTTAQGVVSLTVGGGTVVSGTYSAVPWQGQEVRLRVEVSTDGVNYSDMGSKAIQPVPYTIFSDSARVSYRSAESTISLFADSAARAGYADSINLRFSRNLVVVGNDPANPDDPIFEVKNSKGEVLFGVYQEGVRVNIPDSAITKGAKGGFAVGGLTGAKGEPVEYLRITPDSARVYVKQSTGIKGAKGGFAVGGLTNQTKAVIAQDLLFVNPDSARFYINENLSKGAKGGFAVGGLTNGKTSAQLIQLTKDNYLIGYEAGASITTGQFNSFLGFQAGKANSTGNWNTFLGYQTGLNNTGSDNTFIGYQAGMLHQFGGGNVYLGSKAGGNALNGVQNIAIGEQSGFSTSTGFKNIFIGYMAGYSNTSGYSNIFIGNESGKSNTDGNRNMFFGNGSGFSNTSGFGNTFFGLESGYYNVNGFRNLFLGYRSGYKNVDGSDNSFLGDMAGSSNTSGNENTFVGQASGASNDTGRDNTFLGSNVGRGNTNGSGNVMVGRFTGYNINGNNNTFIGTQSAANFNTGPFIASSNVCIGYASGTGLTNGFYNIFIGQQTGTNNGFANVIIGHQAGLNCSGNSNVFIGYQAGISEAKSNRLHISNSGGDSTQALIYGRFDSKEIALNARVGIGTTVPDKQLHVVGDARITGNIYCNDVIKPDFVFKPDYSKRLDPLSVERFIARNGHLPWLTKASEERDGINLTRMQFETVETVENLQLQIIQQQKEIENLKAELETLKKLIKQ
ncbi:MAG TPA: hypothetical protein PLW22_04400 [Tenuifilum sp.]|uniref:hypothetical protein n=1 Tax=Tenuifilum sp. TaxID=2760880 RepID=UPI002D117236|nr:hypothetical protein [Tenuifilum sp.]